MICFWLIITTTAKRLTNIVHFAFSLSDYFLLAPLSISFTQIHFHSHYYALASTFLSSTYARYPIFPNRRSTCQSSPAHVLLSAVRYTRHSHRRWNRCLKFVARHYLYHRLHRSLQH